MHGLSRTISKWRILAAGFTVVQFERRYRINPLQRNIPADAERILMVDDVMTKGSKAAQALQVLREQRSETKVVVATGSLMIVKQVVENERGS